MHVHIVSILQKMFFFVVVCFCMLTIWSYYPPLMPFRLFTIKDTHTRVILPVTQFLQSDERRKGEGTMRFEGIVGSWGGGGGISFKTKPFNFQKKILY